MTALNIHVTRRIFTQCVGLAWCLLSTPGQAGTDLQIMTEEYAPYSFEKDGEVRGISADILVMLLEKTGSAQGRKDIQLKPWARAYKMTQEQANTVLFTVARTSARENEFKWVGPIFQNIFHVYALKDRRIKIAQIQDIKKYKMGTIRGDVFEDSLVKLADMKITDFQRAATNLQTIKQLRAGAIDLTVQSPDTLQKLCRENGFRFEEFEPVFVLEKIDLYYAFNKDTPTSLVKSLQGAFDALKKSGKVDEVFQKYQ